MRKLFRFMFILVFVVAMVISWVSCNLSTPTQAPGKPSHHLSNNTFRNPQGSIKRDISYFAFAKFFLRRIPARFETIIVPENHVIPESQGIKNYIDHEKKNHDTITWLGHATFLIRIGHQTILTDPFLTDHAGPGNFGPKRFVAPGISIQNLPEISTVLVSHNHYDSLDLKTLEQLSNKKNIQVIVPLRLGKYFKNLGYQHIDELDWSDSVEYRGIKYTAIPAVHWSRRGLFDYNKTLWAGFIIHSKHHKILYMCDSAYSDLFKTIGKKYGPFDMVIIDIGAYEPADVMRLAHTTPEQSVQIALDLRAKTVVAMHWGTVVISEEPPFEPPVRFKKAAIEAGFKPSQAWVMIIGETRAL